MMRRRIRNVFWLLPAMLIIVSVPAVSAFAKSDKSAKSCKVGNETSADAPEAPVSAAATVHATVTLEDAKEIALNHAGTDSAGVVFSKEKLDKGVYELKFRGENGKYEYEISAVDGSILDYKCEMRNLVMPVSAEPGDSSVWEGTVSEEEARQAALDAAGVDEDALKYLVCYISWTNHVPIAYEVKFATRRAAYHYTIDLDSGTILGSVCYPRH